MVHDCNLSYSGGKDQENCGSKPAQENSSREKKSHRKIRSAAVAQGEGPEFKPQYHKKKKKQKNIIWHVTTMPS
jgi:hypothetical protein